MIQATGTLVVKCVSGSKGTFNVADLETSIGVFKVRSNALEQFDEGAYYKGSFCINKVYIHAYPWRGMLMTEMRADIAQLDTFFSNQAEEKKDQAAHIALNEMEEASITSSKPIAVKPEPILTSLPPNIHAVPAAVANSVANEVDGLDGIHQAIKQNIDVKLDPMSNRNIFREARDLLKAAGYKFEVKQQIWSTFSAYAICIRGIQYILLFSHNLYYVKLKDN